MVLIIAGKESKPLRFVLKI